MTKLQLLDYSDSKVAEVIVKKNTSGLFTGYLLSNSFTDDQLKIFRAFEDNVNSNVLSNLDALTQQIEAFGLKVINPASSIEEFKAKGIYDFQMFGSRVSFRMKT
ncbi:MAG: hypothetical protein AAF632_07860 [Bacteroidota bacterium]